MMNFKLVVNALDYDNSLGRKCPQIWGEIYIIMGSCCFPSDKWYDLVSSILDMWIPSILDFINNRNAKCELFFMDGPYKIYLGWVSSDEIRLSMFRGNQMLSTHTCYLIDFLKQIISGVKIFLEFCDNFDKEDNPYFISGSTFPRIAVNGANLEKIVSDLGYK